MRERAVTNGRTRLAARRTVLFLVALAALPIDALAGWAILTPAPTPAYRALYLDHTLSPQNYQNLIRHQRSNSSQAQRTP